MTSPGLCNKYRPTKFADVVGQPAAVAKLEAQVARKPSKRQHAVLFRGVSGVGKTSLARILAAAYGCAVGSADFVEMNCGQARGIDEIRSIQSRVFAKPMAGSSRVWLLDEGHSLTSDAQTGLLKMFEDTPAHAYFFVCTTHVQKLIPTLKNRCLDIEVKALTSDDLETLIRRICLAEKIETTDKIVAAIIAAAEGCARQAIQILDSIADIDEEEAALAAISSGEMSAAGIDIMRRLTRDGCKWGEIAPLLKALGPDEDIERLRRGVLGYCSAIMLNGRQSNHLYNVMVEFQRNFFDSGKPGLVLACYAALAGGK